MEEEEEEVANKTTFLARPNVFNGYFKA